jgi:hypothetical protein
MIQARGQARAAAALLATLAVAIASLIVAMALYPGGTALDHLHAGHSFWFNFLCDLTGPVAVNGAANRVGSAFAQVAMAALAIALGMFWLILPWLFKGRRALGVVLRCAGTLSTLGFALVPLASGLVHAAAVFTAVVPAVVAGALGIVGMLAQRSNRGLVALPIATLVASVVDAVLYGASFATHPRVVTPALPAGQRIAVLLMVAWMVATAAVLARGDGNGLREDQGTGRSPSRLPR